MDENSSIEDIINIKVKAKLECLNITSEKINQLENDVNEKRKLYRTTLSESTRSLNSLAESLGECITKARPYYEAKRVSKEAKNAIQEATLKYDQAVSLHVAAREMVAVAENGMKLNPFNSTWVEMLNHANEKVNEAEKEKLKCDTEHRRCALQFKIAEDMVAKLYSQLKTFIKKSQPYFEMKRRTQEKLENTSLSMNEVERKMQSLKETYSSTLRNLEDMSNSLHALRKNARKESDLLLLGRRQEGVGAESSPRKDMGGSDMELDFDFKTVMSDLRKIDSIEYIENLTGDSPSQTSGVILNQSPVVPGFHKFWESDDLICFESANEEDSAIEHKQPSDAVIILSPNPETPIKEVDVTKMSHFIVNKTPDLKSQSIDSTDFRLVSNDDSHTPEKSVVASSNYATTSQSTNVLKNGAFSVCETSYSIGEEYFHQVSTNNAALSDKSDVNTVAAEKSGLDAFALEKSVVNSNLASELIVNSANVPSNNSVVDTVETSVTETVLSEKLIKDSSQVTGNFDIAHSNKLERLSVDVGTSKRRKSPGTSKRKRKSSKKRAFSSRSRGLADEKVDRTENQVDMSSFEDEEKQRDGSILPSLEMV